MNSLRTSQDVILSPVISEKSYSLQEMKKYIFRVHKSANKVQIRRAIEEMFPGVKVAKVNTANILGKKRRRGKVEGKRPDWKKATISIREGEIDLFEQV